VAHDERRRQKKLAKKKAKRQEAIAAPARDPMQALPRDPATIAALPVAGAYVADQLFETGIGNAIICRELSNGKLAVGMFLLDVFCLGVKDAFAQTTTPFQFREQLLKMGRASRLSPQSPAYVKKLVLGTEEWARGIGFEPHADYAPARLLLEGINDECSEQFVFGKDGKPMYVNGPFDTPVKIRHIVETLKRTCGEGGFHYVVREPM
jgi:hypothetical protein